MENRIRYLAIAGAFALVVSATSPIISYAQSVQFSSGSGMSFGLLEFSTSHSGILTLGTNGAVQLTGTGLSYQGDATPGYLTINGNSGIVELKCENTASIGGNVSLSITNIEINAGVGVGPGSAHACQGISGSDPSVMTVDLGATPDVRIYFGGQLNVMPNSLNSSGEHSSGDSGGDPVTLSAVFQ